MKIMMLEAARSSFKARRDEAKANLEIYLTNPIGIGEHGDLVEVVKDLIVEITDAEDNIVTIDTMLSFETSNSEILLEQEHVDKVMMADKDDAQYISSFKHDEGKLFNRHGDSD